VEKTRNAHKVSVKPVTVGHKWNQKIDIMVLWIVGQILIACNVRKNVSSFLVSIIISLLKLLNRVIYLKFYVLRLE